jgi:hypothetical protein
MKEYLVNHVARGCYEVVLAEKVGNDRKYGYLTNFKNKKAAVSFVEAHKLNKVVVDPNTRVPSPDFK